MTHDPIHMLENLSKTFQPTGFLGVPSTSCLKTFIKLQFKKKIVLFVIKDIKQIEDNKNYGIVGGSH